MKEKNVCDCNVVHHDIVDSMKNELIDRDVIQNLSKFYKIIGDETRLKIITVLLNTEMCVCDLSYLLNMSQSLISHQLKKLREARLVKSRRVGKIIFYSLDDKHVSDIISYGLIHIKESGVKDE